MRIKEFLLMGLILALGAARAGAAVVTLKDGSVLRGSVTGQTADGVELATPDGNLHVAIDRIARIDYAEPLAMPLPGVEEPAPAAGAAGGPRRQMVSVGFGLAEPIGRVNFGSIGGGEADNGDLGVQAGVEYLYFVTPRLGAGLDAEYSDRSGTVSPRLLPSATASVGGDTWLTMGILRYSFVDHGAKRPFLLLGAGGAWNTTTVDAHPALWADTGTHETRRLVDDSQWVPAAAVRVGVDFDVDAFAPGVVTLEAGWTGLASARYAATPAGEDLGLGNVSGPLNIVSLTARYGWRF